MKRPEKKELATTGERVVYAISRVVDWAYIIFFLVVLLFCVYVIYDSAMVYEEASNSGIVKEYVLEDDDGTHKIDFDSPIALEGEQFRLLSGNLTKNYDPKTHKIKNITLNDVEMLIIPFIFHMAMIKNTPLRAVLLWMNSIVVAGRMPIL